MVTIAREDQSGRKYVMYEHLGVIFSPLLNIDHHDLLEPKRELYKIVPLGQALHFSIRPVRP